MSLAHICQALPVDASSPGQLLLTAVVCCSDVLQSGLQECLQGSSSCWCLVCTICILLEEVGWGLGLVGSTSLPSSSVEEALQFSSGGPGGL